MVKLGLGELADRGHEIQGPAKILESKFARDLGVAVDRTPATRPRQQRSHRIGTQRRHTATAGYACFPREISVGHDRIRLTFALPLNCDQAAIGSMGAIPGIRRERLNGPLDGGRQFRPGNFEFLLCHSDRARQLDGRRWQGTDPKAVPGLLRRRPVRAGGGHASPDETDPGQQSVPGPPVHRPTHGPSDRHQLLGQLGKGRRRPGGAEHERDVRVPGGDISGGVGGVSVAVGYQQRENHFHDLNFYQ